MTHLNTWLDSLVRHPSGPLAAMRKKHRRRGRRDLSQWTCLDDCAFVKQEKLDEFLSSGHGQHHNGLFRLMISIASRAKKMDHPITAHELAQLADEANRMLGCQSCLPENRPLLSEAENALRLVG